MADDFSGLIKKAVSAVTGIGLSGSGSKLSDEYEKSFDDSGDLWIIDGKDWHQIYGYQFEVKNAITQARYYYTLPIPPQQFSVKPIMANRVTPTIGGVVEEVSPVTFWMISMAGTTGIAIGRRDDDTDIRKQASGKFRSSIATTGLLAGYSAQLNSIISKVGGSIDQVKSALASGSASGIASGLTGVVNDALTPPLPYNSSAVDAVSNGFTESQELSKFFYMYQRLKAKTPDNYELFFSNQKTNQKWRVVVKEFSLQQNSQNPHLYKYQITLQGWDCVSGDSNDRVVVDRFGPNGDLKTVNTIGKENASATSKSLNKLKKGLGKITNMRIIG